VTGITITPGNPTGGTLNLTKTEWMSAPQGATLQLTTTITPSNATDQTVTWSSSDTTGNEVTVNTSGVIKVSSSATLDGTTYTITATANDRSGIKATFSVILLRTTS
jgi:uncharacterized protein YjdB